MCGISIFYIARSLVFHFGLSACAGWLGWRLTLTILSHTTYSRTGVVGFFIHHSPLLVALSCALLAHVAQDYTVHWF